MTKKEAFGLALLGAVVVFIVTTIVVMTGLASVLGEDEDVLFVLRAFSLLVGIGASVGLLFS